MRDDRALICLCVFLSRNNPHGIRIERKKVYLYYRRGVSRAGGSVNNPQWQRDGLAPPAIVRDATSEYLGAEDALASWIDECCVADRSKWCGGAELYDSWRHWAERSGEVAGSRRRFTQNLEARGFRAGRAPVGGKDVRSVIGIAIRSDFEAAPLAGQIE